MRQIILLILLFFVGQWLVKALRRQDARTSTRTGEGARGPGASAANGGTNGAGQSPGNRAARHQLPEPMIRCVECGVHAPKSDSVSVDGQIFCGHEHAQRFATRVAQTKGREGR
ncbi:PP0621 family protein [Paraburkholderia sp. SOS3]|uniref:PP0621 family protein n=1 Tax=Paraburkholderia sp. SOS3 TaxID=1926494 RepID=UPI00094778CF|nr:PP0621 family protein [Paraburkholderia sp. SOS3]APR37003.1 deaminase [Paraburkholderia sp. SOS3]